MANSNTGMGGADAFFRDPPAAAPKSTSAATPAEKPAAKSVTKPAPAQTAAPAEEKRERRSFNLAPSTLMLLEAIQYHTSRNGKKMTLSAIVERGIELAAKEMGVSE